jgi:hypothetical protein
LGSFIDAVLDDDPLVVGFTCCDRSIKRSRLVPGGLEGSGQQPGQPGTSPQFIG